MTAKVTAVCSSRKKGIKKEVIAEGVFIENFGLTDDAHADCSTHRQVSLLTTQSIDKMRKLGLDVDSGDFAENITCEGIDLVSTPIGTRLSLGENLILEITQIGKECHTKCAIYHKVGTCIMPEEGIFARVIKGGTIKAGDIITVLADNT